MSRRETILVTALVTLLAGFLIYKLVYLPQTSRMSELQAELALVRAERAAAEAKIAAIPALEADIAEAEQVARQGAPEFFDRFAQKNLIAFLDEMASQAAFDVKSYNYSPLEDGQVGHAPVKTSVAISYVSTYDRLFSYMRLLEDYDKKILIKTVNISGQDEGTLSGSMTLDFYVLDKLFPDESDLTFTEWRHDLPRSRPDPFGGSQSALQ